MSGPYANCGLAPEEVAGLEACDRAHVDWWGRAKDLGWSAGHDPFSLRIAFNAGWYFCSERKASAGEAGTAETPKSGSVHEHAVGNADAPDPSDLSSPTP